MSNKYAVQLYSVRELASQDYAGTVKKVAKMGYDGVETAGFPGTTAGNARKLFDELGLAVVAAHSPAPYGEKKNEVLDTMAALACNVLVVPAVRFDEFKTIDLINKSCDMLNEAYATCKSHGMKMGYHNHWWEMEVVGDKRVYQWLKEKLNPEIFFELDTYWIKVGGVDPNSVIRELGGRAPFLHIKDGPGIRELPMTAIGTGIMNFPAILAESKPYVDWSIVEFDRCATDILVELDRSIQYLRSLG
jgi:sugar phosphate isomerase/epimerase